MKKFIYSIMLAFCSIAAALSANSTMSLQLTAGPFNSVVPECTSKELDCNPFEVDQPVCTSKEIAQYLYDDESDKCVIPLYKTEHW